MPTKNIDVKNIVAAGFRTVNLSANEIQSIISSPVFKRDIPEVIGPEVKIVEKKETESKATPESVLVVIKDVVRTAAQISAVLEARCKHLKMSVSFEKQPDLWRACSGIFNNFNGTVSFSMYKNLLVYYNQLLAPLKQIG